MKIKYTLLLKVFGIAAKRHAASLISFVESTANEWAVGACLSLRLVIKTAADWQPPDVCNINFLQSKHYLEEDLPVCYELCSPRLILAVREGVRTLPKVDPNWEIWRSSN